MNVTAKKSVTAKNAKKSVAAKKLEVVEAEKPVTKKRKGTNVKPNGGYLKPARENSKQSILIDYLSRPEGASIPELFEALKGGRKPYSPVTIRSAFGWSLKNKGYGTRSEFTEAGEERFFLVVPEGFSIPPHYKLKAK